METFVRIVISVVFINLLTSMCIVDSCPSPSVVYASVGDHITLCWKILPEAICSDLTRFTVMTLFRPYDAEMRRVASADKNGIFFRGYDYNHDGLYKKRVTVDADLQAGMLFLRMANYTNKMENVYCVLYEMSGTSDVQTCHSYAVLLRNIEETFRIQHEQCFLNDKKLLSTTTKAQVTQDNSTSSTMATAVHTTVKVPATPGGRGSTEYNFRTAFIITGSLLGALIILTVVAFVLYCRARKQ